MKRAVPIVLLLVAALLPSRSGRGQEASTKEADAKLELLVNDAIDRGARWLMRQQQADGSIGAPSGVHQLALLALLHSGAGTESPALLRGMARLRSLPAPAWTYATSVEVMLFAEYGRRKAEEAGVPGDFRLEQADLDRLRGLVDWLVEAQGSRGAWRYTRGEDFDHSNSQYALLALKEARRVGLEVPDRTFAAALRHFVGQQEASGPRVPRYRESGGDGVYAADLTQAPGYDRARGWGYTGPAGPTGSMTAAGAAAVAICVSELGEPSWRNLVSAGSTSLRDGLAWLGREFEVKRNPRGGLAWHHYYLYGLERAGVLARVVYMGRHRWYAEGARYLVDAQSPDGAWRTPQGGVWAGQGGGEAVVDTCFALLFLTRATTRAAGVATEDPLLDLTSAEGLDDRAWDDLLAAAVAEYDRLSPERQVGRTRDFALFGPRIVPRLLRGLGSGEPAERERSVRILRSVTGLTFGFDPAGEPAAREAALDRWIAWYLGARKDLALDRASRRLR